LLIALSLYIIFAYGLDIVFLIGLASSTAAASSLRAPKLEYACLFGASFLGERDYALYESSAGPVKEDSTSLEYPCIALSSLNSFRPSCKLGDAVYDESAGSSSPSPSLS